jgi:hypothetical protein
MTQNPKTVPGVVGVISDPEDLPKGQQRRRKCHEKDIVQIRLCRH